MGERDMDIAPTTHLSLCSGYGGIDLGLRRAIPNLRTVAYAEIEAFAVENLLARMEGGQLDAAPIWPDLKSFPWESFRDKVDILSGGYPCQPFSAAGKRLGTEDPRHLWPYIANGIRILRPKLCFFENVEGHISLGLRAVIEELGSIGYKTTWGIFSAREVGAPHQRKRVFILAHRNDTRLEGLRQCGGTGSSGDLWPSRPGEPQHGWEPPRVVANSNSTQPSEGRGDQGDESQARVVGDTTNKRDCHETEQNLSEAGTLLDRTSEGAGEVVGNAAMFYGAGQARGQREAKTWRTGATQYDRQTQPTLGGDADGPAGGMDYAQLCVTCDNRTDELRLLGNGVVPATAERAFRILMQELDIDHPVS